MIATPPVPLREPAPDDVDPAACGTEPGDHTAAEPPPSGSRIERLPDAPRPDALPPIDPASADLIELFIALDLDLRALAHHSGHRVVDLLDWYRTEPVQARLATLALASARAAELHAARVRPAALAALEHLCLTQDNPVERRRAATTLARATAPPRPQRPARAPRNRADTMPDHPVAASASDDEHAPTAGDDHPRATAAPHERDDPSDRPDQPETVLHEPPHRPRPTHEPRDLANPPGDPGTPPARSFEPAGPPSGVPQHAVTPPADCSGGADPMPPAG